jgi:O-antigen/teichoic acid export membrane protein
VTVSNSDAPEKGLLGLRSLRTRVIQGTVYTLLGVGLGNVLRLVGNLILARLLFPEAFGVMAIVNMFMSGLNMFSDIGIKPAIIQHERGNDETFLRTAWTIQIVRGLVLGLCLCILAWPIAYVYKEPQLMWLLPFVGFNNVLNSFISTALAHLNRQLVMGRQTLIDLFSQAVSLAAMALVAWIHPSVWALVIGGTVASAISVVLSHVALPGIKHRLCWDKESRTELFKFGRWITLSTAFTFLSMQADRLIVSTFASMAMIGIYSVASNLSQVVTTVGSRLTGAILFPLYAAWNREGKEMLHRQAFRARVRLMALFLIPPCIMVPFGPPIIELLYDSRYHEAGWMLSLLSLSVIPQVIVLTSASVLLAVGDSYRHMSYTVSRGIVTLGAMAIGGYLSGIKGVIYGTIAGNALQYPFLVRALRAHGCWMPWLDLAAATYALALVGIGEVVVSFIR